MHYGVRIPAAVIVLVAVAAMGAYLAAGGGSSNAAAITKTGAVMPPFILKDCNGKQHSLEQYKGKVVVLEFCSQHCPYSRGADPALSALAKTYADKDVVFLGVDSHAETTPDQIKAYAEAVGKHYPILKDGGSAYADAVGAGQTPEIFVVDKEGKLAYHGAFDNRSGPDGEATEHYTADAVEALLANKKIAKQEVKAWGCTIKRAK